jgi:Ca-activated chloride channel family protein
MMSQLFDVHITFAHPYFFLLLLFIPIMIWWDWKKHKNVSLRISTVSGIMKVKPSFKVKLLPLLKWLRYISVAVLIVALARPQSSDIIENIDSEGIDIVLSIDVSGSMLAEDLKPNRIEAAKQVASTFIEKRITDRIGLVIFSGESFTQCPITIDHNVLQNQLKSIESGMLQDGTAIGMGLATAVDRLRNSKAKSKIVILLTDGVNNTGLIDPMTALEVAKAFKVRVYSIGVGTKGEAPYPVQTAMGIQKQMMPVEIDEALLQKISNQTGGKYYRATSNNSLKNVYAEIDRLEKSKIEINSFKHYTELFLPFALIGLFAMLLEVLLRYTYFRSIT